MKIQQQQQHQQFYQDMQQQLVLLLVISANDLLFLFCCLKIPLLCVWARLFAIAATNLSTSLLRTLTQSKHICTYICRSRAKCYATEANGSEWASRSGLQIINTLWLMTRMIIMIVMSLIIMKLHCKCSRKRLFGQSGIGII